MKPYKWRTIIAGAVYVDSMTGSDNLGNGTKEKPYKTLRRTGAAATVICRGVFSEDMADGNHARTIRGDYMGAAIFDGKDEYIIYGFTHINFIITNCPPGTNDIFVNTGSGLLAGAGRAAIANYVGNVSHVHGVAGSPVILHRTGVYMGCIGGSTAVSNNIFSSLMQNDAYPLSLGGVQQVRENTYYNIPIEKRGKRIANNGSILDSVFGKFDFIVDDAGVSLSNCVIASDCRFFFGQTEILITGNNSDERRASYLANLTAAGVPTSGRLIIDLKCLFSPQSSYDIFNNPDDLDFTLKPNADAIIDSTTHVGALGPAINIGFHEDSDQKTDCWETRSLSGAFAIVDNSLHLDTSSQDLDGELYSKIIRINHASINISGIVSNYFSRFDDLFSYLNKEALLGDEYTEGEILPIGKFKVVGNITYASVTYGDLSIIEVANTGTSFAVVEPGSYLKQINNPNIENVIYVREANYPIPLINSSEGLESGGVYYNHGNETIVYRGRNIVPGESFVAENNTDSFVASQGYNISVVFDDTRVPASEWIPAQLYGEYFVYKDNGAIVKDLTGVPVSSGNVLSYLPASEGGYSESIVKSRLRCPLFQMKIKLSRFKI
jgi:hypothetical protein